MKKQEKIWTQNEINYLINNCKVKSYIDIAKELGRTQSSISYKAQKINLIGRKGNWTKKELNYLKDNYKKKFYFEIASDLNKSLSSIHHKAWRTGLRTGKRDTSRCSEKNGYWKGDEAGISALHGWIKKRKLIPNLCERCNRKKPYDLANINNHNYTRNINDYKWLCRSCHVKFDYENGTREKLIICKSEGL